MTRNYTEGMRVVATRRVTEGGDKHYKGDGSAAFPDPDYIHAERGDHGTVEYVDEDGYPTVFFDRTGTGTVVAHDEVEPL